MPMQLYGSRCALALNASSVSARDQTRPGSCPCARFFRYTFSKPTPYSTFSPGQLIIRWSLYAYENYFVSAISKLYGSNKHLLNLLLCNRLHYLWNINWQQLTFREVCYELQLKQEALPLNNNCHQPLCQLCGICVCWVHRLIQVNNHCKNSGPDQLGCHFPLFSGLQYLENKCPFLFTVQ